MKQSEVIWRKVVDSNTESSDCNMIPLRLLVTQAGDTCTGCSWEKDALRNRNSFSFFPKQTSVPFPLVNLKSFGKTTNCGLFIVTPRDDNTSILSEHFRKSENLPPFLLSQSPPPPPPPSLLICLIALMVDQKKISHCQRNHPSLSQSNYKPGYFLPSAKHIADWYCMTSFSYLFYPKITEESTLILQWNCLGNFSKTSPLKLSLWKNHPLIAVWN